MQDVFFVFSCLRILHTIRLLYMSSAAAVYDACDRWLQMCHTTAVTPITVTE